MAEVTLVRIQAVAESPNSEHSGRRFTFCHSVKPYHCNVWLHGLKNVQQPDSIGGSVVEFSPATREARVRFPADAVLPVTTTVPFVFINKRELSQVSSKLVRWCSGYHICLTRRRSPVRSRPESSFALATNNGNMNWFRNSQRLRINNPW